MTPSSPATASGGSAVPTCPPTWPAPMCTSRGSPRSVARTTGSRTTTCATCTAPYAGSHRSHCPSRSAPAWSTSSTPCPRWPSDRPVTCTRPWSVCVPCRTPTRSSAGAPADDRVGVRQGTQTDQGLVQVTGRSDGQRGQGVEEVDQAGADRDGQWDRCEPAYGAVHVAHVVVLDPVVLATERGDPRDVHIGAGQVGGQVGTADPPDAVAGDEGVIDDAQADAGAQGGGLEPPEQTVESGAHAGALGGEHRLHQRARRAPRSHGDVLLRGALKRW